MNSIGRAQSRGLPISVTYITLRSLYIIRRPSPVSPQHEMAFGHFMLRRTPGSDDE